LTLRNVRFADLRKPSLHAKLKLDRSTAAAARGSADKLHLQSLAPRKKKMTENQLEPLLGPFVFAEFFETL
jgi:hypothetical protein